MKDINISFTNPKLLYRIKNGGGKKQMLAKACALEHLKNPVIIDACAGLGIDAFVLAALGANIIMMERNPLIAASLRKALDEGINNPNIKHIIDRIALLSGDAIILLKSYTADVIYIDPMFPEKTKSALNKKDMRILKDIVGEDQDAPILLAAALTQAKYRIVVKRPINAPIIENDRQPTFSIEGKANRFDIYVNKSAVL